MGKKVILPARQYSNIFFNILKVCDFNLLIPLLHIIQFEIVSVLANDRGKWKSWLKAQPSKNEDHPSSLITSWQIDGETMEIVSDFVFLGSKISADGDCSHEIKRHLLVGRKGVTNLDSLFKRKDIT